MWAVEQADIEDTAAILLHCLNESLGEPIDAEDCVLDELIDRGLLSTYDTPHCRWFTTTETGRSWLIAFVKGARDAVDFEEFVK